MHLTKLLPHLASTLQKLTILEIKFFRKNTKICTKNYGKNEKDFCLWLTQSKLKPALITSLMQKKHISNGGYYNWQLYLKLPKVLGVVSQFCAHSD